MSAALLSALLGVTLMLPRVQALTCQSGTFKYVMNVSALPLNWTASEKVCEDGLGCQDMLMIMENGPQVFLVLIKDCTPEEDHDARVTQHRTGPGLSIISYTHVCRQKDHCNDLSSSLPLSALLVSPILGSMRCPLCLSMEDCESATELTCPVGHTHCYKGVLQLRGGGIYTNLRVQGCMSQAACNLLNQTQKIGPLSLSENCDTNAFLTCQQGVMIRIQQNLTQTPIQWNAYKNVSCDLEEVCQETLLLVDVGPKSLIVGSKSCSKAQTQESQTVTVHSAPPGVLVASYAHFCSSSGCNRASSSHVLLNSLPRPAAPAPGDLQCPICVGFHGSCVFNFEKVMCPKGTTHCYSGDIQLKGGGVAATFSIQGCVAQPSSSLLNHTNNIGEFFTLEISEKKNDEPHIKERDERLLIDGAAPGSYVVWVVGLGLSLALWCGVPSLVTLFPHES